MTKFACLFLKVTFKDLDNNGQVLKDLKTLTKRIKCAEMGFDVHGKSDIYTEILLLSIKSKYLTKQIEDIQFFE